MNNIKMKTGNNIAKSAISFVLVLLMLFTPVIATSTSSTSLFGVSAYAADSYTYYPKYTGSSSSLVDALKAVGVDSSYSNRQKIGALNGISNYSGTASQNTNLLNLLKAGKLVKSKTTTSSSSSSSSYYPKYTGSSGSLVDGLNAVGVDSSYSNRQKIGTANGISNYSGTASQNTQLLNLLKKGTLKRAGTSGSSSTTTATTTSGTLLSSNLSRVKYIKQGSKTCKASSVSMALNVIVGSDKYSTASLGNSCCINIGGKTYKASNGSTYVATYKQDSYVGSLSEQKNAIEKALAAGVPIVVAVHSTKGTTNHHWAVIVGKSGSDYVIVDPASGSSGMMSANTKTMSAAGYAFGLTDYSSTHYGYVTFTKK